MQIRTGEGKSMILGAASVMFALLGFKVRTVCYSEYLSDRDFRIFEDVFNRFGLSKYIVYSKITMYAEDATASKGDIRTLTESLLRGNMSPTQSAPSHCKFASSVTQPTIRGKSNTTKAVVTPLANRKRELEIGEDLKDNDDDDSPVINGG
jgi:preprotein translocase subunit SecA